MKKTSLLSNHKIRPIKLSILSWTVRKFIKASFLVLGSIILLYEVYDIPPVEHISTINLVLNQTRDVKELMHPKQNTIRLIPRSSCYAHKKRLTILIAVTSAIENIDRRTVIRETWGKDQFSLDIKYQLMFVLGKSLNNSLQNLVEAEHRIFGDILQDPFIDTKLNLTLKTLFTLKYFAQFCSKKVEYLLKVQDNVYINTAQLHEYIQKKRKANLLIGSLHCGVWNKQGYHHMTSNQPGLLNDSVYPNFLSGTSYLMSKATAYTLYRISMIVPIFHLESIYITGILPAEYNKLVNNEDKNILKNLLKDHAATLSDIEIHPETDYRFDQNIYNADSCSMTTIISSNELSTVEMHHFHIKMNTLRNSNDEKLKNDCDAWNKLQTKRRICNSQNTVFGGINGCCGYKQYIISNLFGF